MRVKLDENLGTREAEHLTVAGLDVATVVGEDSCSVADATRRKARTSNAQAFFLVTVLVVYDDSKPATAHRELSTDSNHSLGTSEPRRGRRPALPPIALHRIWCDHSSLEFLG